MLVRPLRFESRLPVSVSQTIVSVSKPPVAIRFPSSLKLTVASESDLRIFLSGWSKFAFIFSSEVPQFEMLFMYAGGEHVSVRIECKLNALDLVARNLHVPNVTTA